MIHALPKPAVYTSPFCAPVVWVSDKIRTLAQKVFGYLVRIVTFQLGEFKVRGAYPIMRLYQRCSSDPREEKPFDPKRLAESEKHLKAVGGQKVILGNRVPCMTFKSEAFFAAFQNLGAPKISIIHEGRERAALLDPPELAHELAQKFYFPTIDIQMQDGTVRKGALLPEAITSLNPPLILHSLSPGRSMCMDRRFIGLHLAAGYDVAIWDPAGKVEGDGRGSEGSHYLDAEAVFEHARKSHDPKRIYVSGFCLGAACQDPLVNL